jgi:hypothetical protein
MVLYVRAENQDGRIYELVCDGENQPLPNVGDRIEMNDMKAEVKERVFYYTKPNELSLLLKVREYKSTSGDTSATR